jgi:hypothetical protein
MPRSFPKTRDLITFDTRSALAGVHINGLDSGGARTLSAGFASQRSDLESSLQESERRRRRRRKGRHSSVTDLCSWTPRGAAAF